MLVSIGERTLSEAPYRGQRAALATQHGKEAAIAAAFETHAGLSINVPQSLDTDRFGTFTGEVPRPAPMRETARRKALMGMECLGLPLGIASEGSFGPHPVIPFLPAGHELMIFIDRTRSVEVVEEHFSATTNFASLDITPDADVEGFLSAARFPSHGLIFRAGGVVVKGIRDHTVLDEHLRRAQAPIRLETDMRAHMNPTRMAEITALAEKLARRIATPCPSCSAPGFGVIRSEAGLPCADCGTPTGLVRSLVMGCAPCGHEETAPRPDGRITATPAQCLECNP
jgi:hypothetical protein